MATTFTVRLTATDAAGAPASIDTIADVVGRWARISEPLDPQRGPSKKGGKISTETLGSSQDDSWGWRLRWAHPDQNADGVIWTVAVSVLSSETTEIDVRLGRSLLGSALRPSQDAPDPPGCIRALLSSEDLNFTDAGHPLKNRVWSVEAESAEQLSELVLAPERTLPIFAFTGRDDDIIDGGELLRRAPGLAHVAFIKPEASWRLNSLLPEGLNVYGGAGRIWWPGITSSSSRWDHDLWTGDESAFGLVRDASALIVGAGLAISRVDLLLKLERKERKRDSERIQREVSAGQSSYQEAVARAPKNRDTESATADLEKMYAGVIETLEGERETALDLAAEMEQIASEAESRAALAEKEQGRLSYELKRLTSRNVLDVQDKQVSCPMHKRIEDEVDSRGEVIGARNRQFTLGVSFAQIVEQSGERYLQKTVKACADIIIGTPDLLGRRDDHVLRTGEGANDPPRVRARDKAQGRRCSLEKNTAAARRLHYWQLKDGSIEFASTNTHDDMSIPA